MSALHAATIGGDADTVAMLIEAGVAIDTRDGGGYTPLINAAQGLRFLVLDEFHTYRGRQGSDVALLVRRVRDRLAAEQLQCVGTSATIAGGGTYDAQRTEVARVATQVFGAEVRPEHIIMETLRRTTPDQDMSDAAFIAAPSDCPSCASNFGATAAPITNAPPALRNVRRSIPTPKSLLLIVHRLVAHCPHPESCCAPHAQWPS